MTIRPTPIADISEIFTIRTSVRENHLSLEQLRHMGITEESIGTLSTKMTAHGLPKRKVRPWRVAMADADDGGVFALFVRPE